MGLSPSPVGSNTILKWMVSELDKLLDTQLVSENYMTCGKPTCLVSEVVSMLVYRRNTEVCFSHTPGQ